jgi:metal-responsive CopG/Arc/MetJ family transcriptional regulator
MKTAISVPDDLFKEVDDYAKDHRHSRSEVFVLALREFFRKMESANMLAELNAVYSGDESTEEKKARTKSKRHYAKKIAREKY